MDYKTVTVSKHDFNLLKRWARYGVQYAIAQQRLNYDRRRLTTLERERARINALPVQAPKRRKLAKPSQVKRETYSGGSSSSEVFRGHPGDPNFKPADGGLSTWDVNHM
jgi:hypothetical protein